MNIREGILFRPELDGARIAALASQVLLADQRTVVSPEASDSTSLLRTANLDVNGNLAVLMPLPTTGSNTRPAISGNVFVSVADPVSGVGANAMVADGMIIRAKASDRPKHVSLDTLDRARHGKPAGILGITVDRIGYTARGGHEAAQRVISCLEAHLERITALQQPPQLR